MNRRLCYFKVINKSCYPICTLLSVLSSFTVLSISRYVTNYLDSLIAYLSFYFTSVTEAYSLIFLNLNGSFGDSEEKKLNCTVIGVFLQLDLCA